jgi:hypothetical protein
MLLPMLLLKLQLWAQQQARQLLKMRQALR